MPRGGHARSGPPIATAEERKMRGAETRRNHRIKEAARMAAAEAEQESLAVGSTTTDDRPLLPAGCEPPPGLSTLELEFWRYYAPKLKAQRRLTLVARDVLAKYCSALAVVSELRKELAAPKIDAKEKREARRELRQYLNVTRLYESDLILNPATAVRQPGFDLPDPVDPASKDTFDDEFDDDDDTSRVN